MTNILLSMIAGILIIKVIDLDKIHFKLESYFYRMIVVLEWSIFAGAIVFSISYFLSQIIYI